MFKKLSLAAVALVACVGIGLAAGNFGLWPILGGASYCGSTGTSGCVSTIAAGPIATGLETIPADTNAAQGIQPQTVLVPITSMFSGLAVYESPLTGVSITLAAGTQKLIITPAGTIATHTIVLPASTALSDGYILAISSTQIITALTLTAGSGTTIVPSITTLATANKGTALVYRASTAQWNLLY